MKKMLLTLFCASSWAILLSTLTLGNAWAQNKKANPDRMKKVNLSIKERKAQDIAVQLAITKAETERLELLLKNVQSDETQTGEKKDLIKTDLTDLDSEIKTEYLKVLAQDFSKLLEELKNAPSSEGIDYRTLPQARSKEMIKKELLDIIHEAWSSPPHNLIDLETEKKFLTKQHSKNIKKIYYVAGAQSLLVFTTFISLYLPDYIKEDPHHLGVSIYISALLATMVSFISALPTLIVMMKRQYSKFKEYAKKEGELNHRFLENEYHQNSTRLFYNELENLGHKDIPADYIEKKKYLDDLIAKASHTIESTNQKLHTLNTRIQTKICENITLKKPEPVLKDITKEAEAEIDALQEAENSVIQPAHTIKNHE